VQSILTHPERHPYLHGTTDWASDWIKHGAVLQLTAGSLLGDFGSRAFEHAWQLVDARLAALVATDAHDAIQRPPRLTAALGALSERVGQEAARMLAIDNPLRVFEGKPIEHPEFS
jgi:protein-tyrosine phosphatase